jgi:hypothetical protein
MHQKKEQWDPEGGGGGKADNLTTICDQLSRTS